MAILNDAKSDVARLHSRLWLVAILLVGAVLRLVGLNNGSPPGLAHDEVANWLIDQAILAGEHGVYFTAAYGHEAGFHYWQTAFVALLGDHALALRLPAALAGLLLLAVTYALNRHLFGERVALTATALLALLFWPVFYSRLGLRAITLPVLSGLSAYFWWRGWLPPPSAHRQTDAATERQSWPRHLWPFLVAGVLAGLSLYTYMAARTVPIFYGVLLLYLVLFERKRLRERWWGVLAFGIVYVIITAPLLTYLQQNPGAEFRITEIDAPLQALRNGDIRPVLTNGLKVLGMFGWEGDPLWRQNVAGRPVFEPIVAILFYVGCGLCLWRWRDGRFAFVLLWLSTATVPSIVTVDAPSSIRIINILPFLTVPPAIVIHNFPKLSTVFPRLSTALGIWVWIGLYSFYAVWTGQAIWQTWPQNEEVAFVWQKSLTEMARYVDARKDVKTAVIGGWTPATMDPPTMALTLQRKDVALRHFGSVHTPLETLIIPTATVADPALILYPTGLPLSPAIEEKLIVWGATPEDGEGFTIYHLPFTIVPMPEWPADVMFGEEMVFLGHDVVSGCEGGASCELVTYWRVMAAASGARRLFVHGLDEAGTLVAQHDGLDAPATYWQVGDLLVQHHMLVGSGMAIADLRLGVYDPITCPACQRLLTPAGADHVVLPQAVP